ncbi:hypothetical protein M0Q50_05280 [bacterium]|jgi:hypothetical protein|nr:hypothetical protein [bacterium]
MKTFENFNTDTKNIEDLFKEYIKELFHINDLDVKFDLIDFGTYSFYFYNDDCIIQYQNKSKILSVDTELQVEISNKFNELHHGTNTNKGTDFWYKYSQHNTKLLIKQVMEEYLNKNLNIVHTTFELLSNKNIEKLFNN